MTYNATFRNNPLNGHRKRGSATMAVDEDDSGTGCFEGETSKEQRFKEGRMGGLRHSASSEAEEGGMPCIRDGGRGRKTALVGASSGGDVGGEIGTRGIIGEGMGRDNCGRGKEENASWEQGGEGMEGQSMGRQRLEEGRSQRKLILHFDIRNTILVADSVTQVKVEQALNTFLTGVTWGQEGANGWEWLSGTPSLGPPCKGAFTYYKHLESRLARAPDDRGLLRQATGDFTQVPLGHEFRPYFEKHLRLLRWIHDVPDEKLTMVGTDGGLYHYLLPSFVRLLYQLHADGRDFAIVLRTYGMDARNVLSCLQYIVNGQHPDFRGLSLPVDVRTNPGRVKRHEDGRVEFRVVKEGSGTAEQEPEQKPEPEQEPEVYVDELQIYDLLSGSGGITGYVDDFVHWQSNGYGHRAGKPFWIDLDDDAVQHIFFDDNIRVTAEDSIVDVRLRRARPDDGGGARFESIGLDRMWKFEDACLVQADLLESIDNVDYFVEKVRTCERNYGRLTAAGHV